MELILASKMLLADKSHFQLGDAFAVVSDVSFDSRSLACFIKPSLSEAKQKPRLSTIKAKMGLLNIGKHVLKKQSTHF